MRIKDVQEWDLLRSKSQNWMIVYRGEEVGEGSKFRCFCERHKLITPYKFFFTVNIIFFSLSLHSLLFHSFFIAFAFQAKEITTISKKIRGRTNLKI